MKDKCLCHLEPDDRNCDACAERAFQALQRQCVIADTDAALMVRKHLRSECPTPDDCQCSNRKVGTVSNYQARTYIASPLYCACEHPQYTPIVKTQEGLTGGICTRCERSMPPRQDGRMPEPDERVEGPTYDRWMWAEDGSLVRGPADDPVAHRLTRDGRIRARYRA